MESGWRAKRAFYYTCLVAAGYLNGRWRMLKTRKSAGGCGRSAWHLARWQA
ncbi:hypothetical protein HMPREF9371_2220 [Neisseria shayeganii 871]|uniref:Uncharacterized protein n=1 Tax=Neisseria shayeganii 871 TaxID=1032488 RepID=G4CKT0_9NEIS|nr:hypothetical protein HMPREF9371_2220 [Neisseria shayeganii 871]